MTDVIKRARAFAQQAHDGQLRKYTGDPYFVHCAAVAKRVRDLGGSDAQIAAAYLHDTIEDCDVSHAQLNAEFGAEIADLVLALTDVYTKQDYPELNRAARKEREAQRLGSISDAAKLVKWCDLADNTSSITEHDPRFAKVYLEEKARVLKYMAFEPPSNADLQPET